MEQFVIHGGNALKGEVLISGAINAAVAIIPATILSDGVCTIENIPNIHDVTLIARILKEMGASIKMIGKTTLEIDTSGIKNYVADYESVKQIRASSYLLGALLGKFHKARVLYPGGCNFGVRPIDQHLKGFTSLGADCKVESGVIDIKAKRLVGSNVYMDISSVGATINVLLAAVKAEGTTIIENAAKEPHIVDLANFLNSMGANIMGAGTDSIRVKGVKHLGGTTYSIIPDQIEAGTYMVASAITGGNVLVKNVIPKHLESIIAKLDEAGADVRVYGEAVRVIGPKKLNKCSIKTTVHPGFPTDMQPQFAALLSVANGTSIITEGVWENRFKYVEELNKMGTNISVEGKVAVIEGSEGKPLLGAPVRALDLRAGAALVLAGLVAEGKTTIENIQYIDRGYEDIVGKLKKLGADINRVILPDESSPLELAL